MRKLSFLIFLIIFLIGCKSNTNTLEYYVAPNGSDDNPGTKDKPYATLEKARDEVRKKLKSGVKKDINVILRGGHYYLKKTLVFGLQDSAPEGHYVTYMAFPGEEPIISSGKKITGWKKLEEFPKELPKVAHGKVWVADVPETKEGKWRFRTLYDGEEMLPRARSIGFTPTEDCPNPTLAHRWEDLNTLKFPKGTLKNWDNLEDVEIFIRPTQQWVVNYLPLVSVDEKKLIAKTGVPGTYRLCKVKNKNWKETCWVENVLEALDQPGEWVLNTKEGKLYLWPRDGKPSDSIYAPMLRELILVQGKNVNAIEGDIPVRGIVFKGLTFTCGDRDVWTTEDKGIQHDWEMWDKNNAIVRFRGAEDCAVENCTIRNSGGTGIRIDLYGQNIRITGNKIFNLGGTGILLCGYGPGLKDVNKGNIIQNNELHHLGKLFWHSPAIFIWQSGENKVLNNYIHDLPYDGIVLSGVRPRFFGISDPVKWKGYKIPKTIRENMQVIRWNEVGNPKTAEEALRFAHARNNLVQDNELHNVMEVLGDGNAIYLSCAGKGNIIRRNLIYKSTKAASEIRFDDDQQGSTVECNIIFGNGIKLKHTNFIINNVIIGGGISIRPETEIGAKVERNIIYAFDGDIRFFNTNAKKKLSKLLDLARPDYNMFYAEDEAKGKKFFEMIQKMGHEKHGMFANPLFVDLQKGDVRLKPNSPAYKLGIKSIDIEKIGLLDDPSFKRIWSENIKLF